MRIQQLSKTRSQWEDISTKINDGEICFEKNNESSPMTYKMKIGDGNHKYADLPYFTATDSEGNDITTVISTWVNNNLDASEIALAEWDGVSKLSIYGISESNGIISKGDNHLDITVGSPLTISESNDTVTIGIQDATTSQKGAVTLTNTYDDTNETKATTGKAIKAAIETLDGNATTEDTTGSTAVIINSVSETDGKISSTKKTITEGNKIDISVPTSGNDAGKIIIAHENVASSGGEAINPSDDGTLAFGDYVLTEASRDAQGHIISAKKKALPANPNTHYTSDIIIGGTSSTVTESSSDISSDPYLNHIENSAVTSSHKIEGGTNITTSFNATNHNITITHNTPSNGSSVNPSYPSGSDTLGFGGDVITDFTKDSQGHVVSATKKKLPSNPLTVTSANDETVMIGHHNSGNATASATGYTISNNTLSGSTTTIPTNYSVKKYVDDEIKDAIVGVFKYKGTVSDYQDLERARSGGVKEGYVYIASQDITLDVSTVYLPAGHYEIGDNFIWQGDDNLNGNWNVVSGEDNVTNNNITLNLQGASHTLATVNGTDITVTSPTLQINSPTASGNTTSFIDTLTVSNGQLSATKKTFSDASTSTKGIIKLESNIHSPQSDTCPTAIQTWTELNIRNTQFTSGNHTNITNPSKGILQDPETISPHRSGVTAVQYLPITTKDAVVGLNYEIAPQEVNYTYRAIPESGDGVVNPKIAAIDTIKGNTLVWNQLLTNPAFIGTTGWTSGEGSISAEDNILTFTASSASSLSNGAIFHSLSNFSVVGHIYYISWTVRYNTVLPSNSVYTGFNSNEVTIDPAIFSMGSWVRFSRLITQTASGGTNLRIRPRISSGNTVSIKNPICIDLTKMFGVGHEPTIEDFESLYFDARYDYNAGTLINNSASGIKTIGFNQWDEQWELGILDSRGQPESSTVRWRSKNFCKLDLGAKYYIKAPYPMVINFYDENKNYLWRINPGVGIMNGTFTVRRQGIGYFKMWTMNAFTSGSPTYQNDICINLSWSGYRNGEYEPYEEHTVYFDSNRGANGSLATIKGRKLNAQGEPTGDSVVVFEDGLKVVGYGTDMGNVLYDEAKGQIATKKIIRVDLGSLTYNQSGEVFYVSGFATTYGVMISRIRCAHFEYNGYAYSTSDSPDNTIKIDGNTNLYIHCSSYSTPEAFKTAMNGVYAYCCLTTPETYLLDNPLPSLYGKNPTTEERLPADTASIVAAPIRYTARYDIAYVSLVTLNNLVDAINTIFSSYDGGSIHPVLRSETNDFDFITQLPLA